MGNVRTSTGCGLAIAAILLSPIAVIFSIPLTIGIGLDIFDLIGEGPFMLALCAPAVFVLFRLALSGNPASPPRRGLPRPRPG